MSPSKIEHSIFAKPPNPTTKRLKEQFFCLRSPEIVVKNVILSFKNKRAIKCLNKVLKILVKN